MTETPGAVDPTLPIVVGVDGSESSTDALRWAVRQAELTGAPLLAAISWSYPNSYGYLAPWPSDYDPEADATTQLERVIADVVPSTMTIRREVLSGHPALGLEDLSTRASLLVVGSRGHGEFAGMLLGSVSAYLATHAHCPIVIVRSEPKP
jgi:nucleotide-binding universal stress UspA family protein